MSIEKNKMLNMCVYINMYSTKTRNKGRRERNKIGYVMTVYEVVYVRMYINVYCKNIK